MQVGFGVIISPRQIQQICPSIKFVCVVDLETLRFYPERENVRHAYDILLNSSLSISIGCVAEANSVHTVFVQIPLMFEWSFVCEIVCANGSRVPPRMPEKVLCHQPGAKALLQVWNITPTKQPGEQKQQ